MDGENNGKPYFLMDDLGENLIFGNIHFTVFLGPTLRVDLNPETRHFDMELAKLNRTQWPMGQGKKNAEKTRMGPGGWWRVSSI